MSATYIDDLSTPVALNPADTALLVIDMQYASGSRDHGLGRHLASQGRLAEADYRFTRIETLVVPNTRRLIAAFRQAQARVIYLTIGSLVPDFSDAPPYMRRFFAACNNRAGAREHEILDELRPEPGEPVLNKTTQGAFASTGLDALLRAQGVRTLVCVGVSTNNCVETTAREAADRGYGVALVSDATGTCSDDFQDVTLRGFRRLWGRVLSAEDACQELLGGPAAPR